MKKKALRILKTVGSGVLALMLALAFFGCVTAAPKEETPTDETALASTDAPKKIGIIQLTEHPALSAAREGFVQALADNGYIDGENITINSQIGSGDVSALTTIADQLIGDDSDLILAIATPAAQAVVGKTQTIPVLGTAITDYVVAGLIESNEAPGRNVSGTTDMNPVEQQIDLLLQLAPDTKTIGTVYNSSEDNSRLQADIAKAYAESKGLTWKEITVANSNDVQQAVTAIVEQVDALYLPTDNIIASTMPTVYSVTAESKTPVICGEQNMVENGGLATLGINYFDLGYQTGLMALKVLNGEDISKMSIESSTTFDYYINGEVAAAIGIEIPAELQQYVQ